MIPASTIADLETQIALIEPMPRIGLAVVCFPGYVDLHLCNE